VLALQPQARLSFVVDHMEVARSWSEAMAAAGSRAEVLLKVDVGFHRCGIPPEVRAAVAFLQAVDAMPGLRLAGILSHAGHAYHAASEDELRAIARQEAGTLANLRARPAGIGGRAVLSHVLAASLHACVKQRSS